MHLSSRSLSIIVAIVVLYRMWPNRNGLLSIALAMAAPLLLIWFPARVDEVTFGTWDKGNRINVHTPAIMIAMFGWVILLLEASIVFDPGWVTRFLYGG
jgi:hypothetical protein